MPTRRTTATTRRRTNQIAATEIGRSRAVDRARRAIRRVWRPVLEAPETRDLTEVGGSSGRLSRA